MSRLRKWGFNSLGAWSNTSLLGSMMPYTELLGMASGNDWFAPSFVTNAYQVAQISVAPLKNDPNLIGYFTDSELRWGPYWTDQHTLLDSYLQLPVGSPGRAVAEEYIHNPNGFLSALATRYFSVTTAAIRSVDPNHMILGVKMLAQLTTPAVLEAAAPYVDLFSIDDYALIGGLSNYVKSSWSPYLNVDGNLSLFYKYLHKPIMVAEYSFRGAGGLAPNTWPPIYPTYPNQQDKAQAYESYIKGIYASPWVVGDQWFEFVDEPVNGRFDGENSNFGLVSTLNVPCSDLVNAMTVMHSQAPTVLAGTPSPCWSDEQTGFGNQVKCLLYANSCPTNVSSPSSVWPYCTNSTTKSTIG
ncbi:MAG: hypothetical protein HKL80_05555 [Acidimicrobiales bacterium]|nr:hypothetical protein [Acidimicrobiales bacterium]